MFNFIKRYFHKASIEIQRDYALIEDEGLSVNPNQWDYEHLQDSGSSIVSWIGVDLDGTLARYNPGQGMNFIGEPVPAMADLVRKMVKDKVRVKIFTARACDPDQLYLIRKWLFENGFPEFEITNVKDYQMIRLYDDRCIQVERNTGILVCDTLQEKRNV